MQFQALKSLTLSIGDDEEDVVYCAVSILFTMVGSKQRRPGCSL